MKSEMKIATLVRAAKAGDEQAYRELMEAHADVLRAFVVRRLPGLLRRKVSITDVLQETSWAGWRAIETFDDRGEGSFRAWITRIAEHKVQDMVRHYGAQKRAAHQEVRAEIRPATRDVAGLQASPSQQAIGRELADQIREGLKQLTPLQRLVLHMVRIEGASIEEVGRRMGRSSMAVQKAYERAKSKLWAVCFEDGEQKPEA